MLLFSPLQVVENHSIFIPDHIRAALGIHNGTELYLSTISCPESSLGNEIIVAPISLRARGEIWRVRVTFRDRPGILSELLQLLGEEKIEVVSSRTTVLEQNQILSVELQINAGLLNLPTSSTTSQWETAAGPTLPELHARILAKFIEDLDFPFGTKPILSIRRNIPLYRSKIHLEKREKTILAKNRILVSRDLENHIKISYGRVYPSISGLTGSNRLPIASIVGDAENAVIRIMFIYKNTGHIHIRVKADKRTECLQEITAALYNRHFNVLRMYTRLVRNREENLTDFLLHLPAEFDEEKSDISLKKYVSGIFKISRLKRLSCQLIFPRFLGKPSRKRNI